MEFKSLREGEILSHFSHNLGWRVNLRSYRKAQRLCKSAKKCTVSHRQFGSNNYHNALVNNVVVL